MFVECFKKLTLKTLKNLEDERSTTSNLTRFGIQHNFEIGYCNCTYNHDFERQNKCHEQTIENLLNVHNVSVST